MRRLAPLAMILLLVSCATTAAPGPAQRPAVDPGASPTEAGPSLATSLPTPAAPPSAAPVASLAPPGERLASAQADFDCDGNADLLEFFDAPRPGTYESVHAGKLARLTLGLGAVRELAFDGMPFDDPGRSPLVGIADVNGDGCDDAIVTVGRGASTTWTGFLVYAGNELRRVEEDGGPATFIFGGSVRHGNAIECRTRKDATEILTRGVSNYTSDFQWDMVEDIHRWASTSRLVLASTTRSVILVSVRFEMPPDASRYWGLSCGGLNLGH